MTPPFDLRLLRALPPRVRDRLEPAPAPAGAPPGCCVVWVGRRFSRNGYGRVYAAGAERVVHGVVWRALGGAVPPGHVLDHRCRVRACAAPWHLEPVTHAVNVRRGEATLFRSLK